MTDIELIDGYVPAGSKLRLGSRACRPALRVRYPRQGHEVHERLRRGVRLDWHRDAPHSGPFAPCQCVRSRFVRTVRRECLDHLLVVSRQHLESVLAEYVRHYNTARPHRGLLLDQPILRRLPGFAGRHGVPSRRPQAGVPRVRARCLITRCGRRQMPAGAPTTATSQLSEI